MSTLSLASCFCSFLSENETVFDTVWKRRLCVRSILLSLLGVRSYARARNRRAMKRVLGKDSEKLVYLLHRQLKQDRDVITVYWRAFGEYLETQDVVGAADHHNIGVVDLNLFLTYLSSANVSAFRALNRDWRSSPLSDRKVVALVKQVAPRIRSLVMAKCRVIWTHTRWLDKDDVFADFEAEAARIVLLCDECRSIPKIVNIVLRSLENYWSSYIKKGTSASHGALVDHKKIPEYLRATDAPELGKNDFVSRQVSMTSVAADGDEIDLPGLGVDSETPAVLSVESKIAAMAKKCSSGFIRYLRVVVLNQRDPELEAWLDQQKAGISRASDAVFRKAVAKFYGVSAKDYANAAQLVVA